MWVPTTSTDHVESYSNATWLNGFVTMLVDVVGPAFRASDITVVSLQAPGALAELDLHALDILKASLDAIPVSHPAPHVVSALPTVIGCIFTISLPNEVLGYLPLPSEEAIAARINAIVSVPAASRLGLVYTRATDDRANDPGAGTLPGSNDALVPASLDGIASSGVAVLTGPARQRQPLDAPAPTPPTGTPQVRPAAPGAPTSPGTAPAGGTIGGTPAALSPMPLHPLVTAPVEATIPLVDWRLVRAVPAATLPPLPTSRGAMWYLIAAIALPCALIAMVAFCNGDTAQFRKMGDVPFWQPLRADSDAVAYMPDWKRERLARDAAAVRHAAAAVVSRGTSALARDRTGDDEEGAGLLAPTATHHSGTTDMRLGQMLGSPTTSGPAASGSRVGAESVRSGDGADWVMCDRCGNAVRGYDLTSHNKVDCPARYDSVGSSAVGAAGAAGAQGAAGASSFNMGPASGRAGNGPITMMGAVGIQLAPHLGVTAAAPAGGPPRIPSGDLGRTDAAIAVPLALRVPAHGAPINLGAAAQPAPAVRRYVGMHLNFDMDPSTGQRHVRVSGVASGGPADGAGAQEGDICIRLDRQTISTIDDFKDIVANVPLRGPVPFEVRVFVHRWVL